MIISSESQKNYCVIQIWCCQDKPFEESQVFVKLFSNQWQLRMAIHAEQPENYSDEEKTLGCMMQII